MIGNTGSHGDGSLGKLTGRFGDASAEHQKRLREYSMMRSASTVDPEAWKGKYGSRSYEK